MNLNRVEAFALMKALMDRESELPQGVDVMIAPPTVYLSEMHSFMSDSSISLGSQNAHFESNGAYTGEVSPSMLYSAGVSHVILGHSERRQYFGETDALVAKKVRAALDNRLKPVVCVGEQKQERLDKKHLDVVAEQLREGLSQVDAEEMKNVAIAYEPVWAIGTGLTATSEQAQEMHLHLRNTVGIIFEQSIAEDLTIVYGGSCKPANASELFAMPDVDGGLIGGASLKADDFMSIIHAAE